MLRGRPQRIIHALENAFSPTLLVLITLILALDIVARLFGVSSLRASTDYVRHLVLWIAFASALITTREKSHLSLSIGVERMPEAARRWVATGTSLVATCICVAQTAAALSFVLSGFDPMERIGVIPIRLATLIMPIGFGIMAVRFILTPERGGGRRWIALIGVPLGLVLGWDPLVNTLQSLLPSASRFSAWLSTAGPAVSLAFAPILSGLHLPLIIILIASVFLGGPIFVLVGGLALLFFLHSGGAAETAANQAYTMLTGDVIPSIPLFTLAGYIISESKSGERLVRLFRTFFGWLPGGLAFMSILICAFLTTFTGASGVTIIAVGSLLLFILTGSGYNERFGRGLLTASGSIGLLFPPSLPVILYGVVSLTNIKQMFVGGVLPGAFLVVSIGAMGVWRARRDKVPRTAFEARQALPALGKAAGEILLPVLILVLFLKGITTLVETGAVTVIYALLLEVAVHRDLKLRQLPGVFLKSVIILGGILIILASASGFSYYIVDAQIPTQLAQWLQVHVQSPYVFLLLLNLVLIIKGFFIDIFSAITIVVPLIAPLGVLYGINPVHLGIIFLANLELGYLTPPLGLNLFLASYRFEKPLVRIYRDVIPFQLVMLAGVLIITYVPWMTTALLGVFKF
ncbi:MAG: TRAP transporter large permease subunit [Spirochaetia bacterium]|jgi:tripartite ATP-independent transporter DctM subunit